MSSTNPVSDLFVSSAMEKNLVVAIQKTEDMGNATQTLNAATQMYLSANALLLRPMLHRSKRLLLLLRPTLHRLKRLLLMLYQILPRFSPAESVGIDSNSKSLQSLAFKKFHYCRCQFTSVGVLFRWMYRI